MRLVDFSVSWVLVWFTPCLTPNTNWGSTGAQAASSGLGSRITLLNEDPLVQKRFGTDVPAVDAFRHEPHSSASSDPRDLTCPAVHIPSYCHVCPPPPPWTASSIPLNLERPFLFVSRDSSLKALVTMNCVGQPDWDSRRPRRWWDVPSGCLWKRSAFESVD